MDGLSREAKSARTGKSQGSARQSAGAGGACGQYRKRENHLGAGAGSGPGRCADRNRRSRLSTCRQIRQGSAHQTGVWEKVEAQLVRAEDVRSALAFVARGDAPFGIVYLTDAKIEKRVKLLDVFPQEAYPAIRYPIAMTAGAGADASRFVEFVTGKRAAVIFQNYGFALIATTGQAASAADTDPFIQAGRQKVARESKESARR